jgi:hypothetical protein
MAACAAGRKIEPNQVLRATFSPWMTTQKRLPEFNSKHQIRPLRDIE